MSETHKPVGAIFDTAIELPPERRAAYLHEACAGDDSLRQRVEALLRAHEVAGTFMESLAVAPGRETVVIKPAEQLGNKIDRYKLLQQIGEGGCGVVYMAEQEQPVRRRVALKVIKLGMDTKSVIARFEAERQTLALMDHPNIAKVLDAGATETGRPYFVMELVRGIKITEFCDKNNLSTRERLKLFIQVCGAIQHAHQKSIIHRDIKPSNILVTLNDGVPLPMVIDFGIAKATQQRLTDKTLFTAFEQFIGTPAYMSPEQAEMNALGVDTRSDIYSLGVLLYELLTGKTPFAEQDLLQNGVEEIRRIIREVEPMRPSTRLSTMVAGELTMTANHRQVEPPKLIHAVRGELDWIVMKALDKDRGRRYETANGFARDVERYLADEPVTACPPSKIYQFGKTVRRHKFAFTLAASVLVALVIGLGISSYLYLQERQAQKEAQSEAVKSQQVAQFLKEMLNGVGPSVALGRDTTMLREIVDKTGERLGTDLTNQPQVEIELRLALGQVYSQLQLYKRQEEMALEAQRLAQTRLGRENLSVAEALNQLSEALLVLHILDQAETSARATVAMQRKLRGVESLQEAHALCTLGDALRCQCEGPGVVRDCQIDPARVTVNQVKLDEAESCYRKALAIQRKRLGREDDLAVAITLDSLSMGLRDANKLTDAESVGRQALAIRRKLLPEEHTEMTRSFMWLGSVLAAENKLEEAETCLRKAIPIQRRTQGQGKWFQAVSLYLLAEILQRQDKLNEAEDCFRQALAIARTQMGSTHPDLPKLILALADVLHQKGELAEGSTLGEEAIRLCREHPDQAGELAYALAESIPTLLDTGKFAEAESVARECLVIREKIFLDDWRTFDTQSMLGGSLLEQKKYPEAERLLFSGYEGLKQREDKIPPRCKSHLKAALQRGVQLYEATHQPEQATDWRKKLADLDPPAVSTIPKVLPPAAPQR